MGRSPAPRNAARALQRASPLRHRNRSWSRSRAIARHARSSAPSPRGGSACDLAETQGRGERRPRDHCAGDQAGPLVARARVQAPAAWPALRHRSAQGSTGRGWPPAAAWAGPVGLTTAAAEPVWASGWVPGMGSRPRAPRLDRGRRTRRRHATRDASAPERGPGSLRPARARRPRDGHRHPGPERGHLARLTNPRI